MMKHFRLMAAADLATLFVWGFSSPAHSFFDEPTPGE